MLLLVFIPIIIHLFNFRRYRKVYFTNVKLLSAVRQNSKKQSRLKHLLLLVNRLFFVICLVLIFAGPYIPSGEKESTSGTRMSLFVDNSLSMEAKNDRGELFEQAKQIALNIVRSLPDNAQIVIHSASNLSSQSFVSKEKATELLNEIKIQPVALDLNALVHVQNDLIEKNADLRSVFITDFQKNGIDADLEYFGDNLLLLPLQAELNDNISIDSVWFENVALLRAEQLKMFVSVRNWSNSTLDNLNVQVMVNDTLFGIANVSIPPNQSTIAEVAVSFNKSGFKTARVVIDDYPVNFDDVWYLSFKVREKFNVYCVNGVGVQNSIIEDFYQSDSIFLLSIDSENSIDYSLLSNADVLVVNQLEQWSSGFSAALKNYLTAGGCVVLFPSLSSRQENYLKFVDDVVDAQVLSLDSVKMLMDNVDFDSPYFKGVFDEIPDLIDYPYAQQYFYYHRDNSTEVEKILSFKNEDALLLKKHVAKGELFLWSVPFDSEITNLQNNPIIYSLMHQISTQVRQENSISNILFSDALIAVNTPKLDGNELRLKSPNADNEWMPNVLNKNGNAYIRLSEFPENAGNYSLETDDLFVQHISLNYSREESNLELYSADSLKYLFQPNEFVYLGEASNYLSSEKMLAQAQQEQATLVDLFIWLTLLFLFLESLIIRFLR